MTGFTPWRASAVGVHRDQIVLESHTSCECGDPAWRDSLLVVEDGQVTLSTGSGQVGFTSGAMFAMATLIAPVLYNPGPTRAAITRVRRHHPSSSRRPTAPHHLNATRRPESAHHTRPIIIARGSAMNMKLELVPMPVTDVDRAKAFYVDQLGFVADVDVTPTEGVRVVQLTPPGSACSIGMGTGVPAYNGTPGTVRGVHLVVDDIAAVRDELLSRGAAVGDIQDVGGGVKYAGITDPDGNTLTLQEMAWRTGEAF